MLKPLEGLTGTLLTLLKVYVVLLVAVVFSDLYEYHAHSNLPADVDPNVDVVESDLVAGIMALAHLGFFIYLGVTFLRWVHRANKNLRELSNTEMQFTPGWAVGWYFVPIANLFKPYQAMREIWQVAHADQDADHKLVNWWWGLWIVSLFVGNASMRLYLSAEDAVGYAAAAVASAASNAFDVVLTVVAIKLVSRIGEAYSANFGEGYEMEHGQPATLPPPLPNR